mgnify:CR=1 FL=1
METILESSLDHFDIHSLIYVLYMKYIDPDFNFAFKHGAGRLGGLIYLGIYRVPGLPYMGQFLQGGKNGRFASLFF